MYYLTEELARELQQSRELAAHWDEIQAFLDSLKEFKIPKVNEGQTDVVSVGEGQFADHFEFNEPNGWVPDAGPDDGPNPWLKIIKDLGSNWPKPDLPDLPALVADSFEFEPIPTVTDVFDFGL